MKAKYRTVDEYIEFQTGEVQPILKKFRAIIKKCSPDSVESISYGMPAYKLNGKPLIYFATYKKHIGLYATPSGHKEFQRELSIYKQGRGSVQFPLDKPMPYDLVKKMVLFRNRSLSMS